MKISDEYIYKQEIQMHEENHGRMLINWEPNGNMHLLCCEKADCRSIVKFIGCDGLQIHVSAHFNKVNKWMLKKIFGLEIIDYVAEKTDDVE